jgi:hypothetical protein
MGAPGRGRSVVELFVEEGAKPAEVILEGVYKAGLVEGGGGMIDGKVKDAAHAPGLAVLASDREPGVDERLGGETAEGADDFGIDERDLGEEMVAAGFDFGWLGIAVSGGPALDDIGDEDVSAVDADLPEVLGEETAGGADEGASLAILVAAGGLANEHNVGGACTLAGNGARAALREGAEAAGADLGVDLLECVFGVR